MWVQILPQAPEAGSLPDDVVGGGIPTENKKCLLGNRTICASRIMVVCQISNLSVGVRFPFGAPKRDFLIRAFGIGKFLVVSLYDGYRCA